MKKKREMNLTPSPKINSERIMELRRREALERGAEDTSGGLAMFLLLRKKKHIGKYIGDVGLDKDHLDTRPKSRSIKNKLDFINMNFCSSKETVKRMKREVRDIISGKHVSATGLYLDYR